MAQEDFHRWVSVIACDTGVEVLPDSLDSVVVGTVRRQKVEHDTTFELSEEALGNLARVNDVVIHDKMDAASLGAVLDKLCDEVTEQRTPFAWTADGG